MSGHHAGFVPDLPRRDSPAQWEAVGHVASRAPCPGDISGSTVTTGRLTNQGPGMLGAPTAQPSDQSLEQTDASSLFRPCHGSQASLLRGPLSLRSRCALVSKDDFDSKHRLLLLPFMERHRYPS